MAVLERAETEGISLKVPWAPVSCSLAVSILADLWGWPWPAWKGRGGRRRDPNPLVIPCRKVTELMTCMEDTLQEMGWGRHSHARAISGHFWLQDWFPLMIYFQASHLLACDLFCHNLGQILCFFFPLEKKNPVEVSKFCWHEGCRSWMNEERSPEPNRVPRAYSRIMGTTVDHQITLWCHRCHLHHSRQPGLRKKCKKKGNWPGTGKTNASLSKVSDTLLHFFFKRMICSL